MSTKINILRKFPLLDRGLFFLSFIVPYIQQHTIPYSTAWYSSSLLAEVYLHSENCINIV